MSGARAQRHGVKESHFPCGELPLVVEPSSGEQRLLDWARGAKGYLDSRLREHGGVLLRNFKLDGVEQFERFIGSLTDKILDYSYRSTPRSEVSGKIFTSTEYPAEQSIPMHNEMSYTSTWPLKIWFYCVQPAPEGGETPIADSRKVFLEIPSEIREKFVAKGITYVRNYGLGVDLSWRNVFQTEQKADVEAFCRSAGIDFEWTGPDSLRTRETCQAVVRHPLTGEEVWFNQAHLFHVSSLGPEVREFLLEEYGEERLPRNTYYGDGSPIGDDALDAIRAAYECHSAVFDWCRGDVLMLDNMRIAHGRRPFRGPRQVVVGMAESWPR